MGGCSCFVEREKEYVVSAELSGMDENELEVKLSSGVLTIRGEKKEERKEEQPSYRVSEALRIIRAVISGSRRASTKRK